MNTRPLLTLLIATAACGQEQPATVPATVSGTVPATVPATVPDRGEYAKVDVARTSRAIRILRGEDAAARKTQMEDIQKNSANYAPPAMFELAGVLWEEGQTWDAVFWFNAGRLRGRYDAARCADDTARQGIDVMVLDTPLELVRAQFTDLDRLEATIGRIIKWDEQTPYNYDHRWINLHGIGAFVSALDPANRGQTPAMSLPEKDWPGLSKQTRDNYRAALKVALEKYRQHKAGTAGEP